MDTSRPPTKDGDRTEVEVKWAALHLCVHGRFVYVLEVTELFSIFSV